jgi:hypothetical protein
MKLKSTTKFDNDYSFLRKMVVSGKVKAKDAKNWIQLSGKTVGDRAELEADDYAKKLSTPRKTSEDSWKDEVVNLKLTSKDE